MKWELREIDRVTVKGSIEPIWLYTYDVDTRILKPNSSPKPKFHGLEKKR